jgi:transcriptional repressor NrdR
VSQDGKSVRRRRECESCEYRFTTQEEVKVLDIKVQKRNGQLVDFSMDKLQYGVRKAFNKRTVDNRKVHGVVQKVIEEILETGKNPITTKKIGRIVLKKLKDVDEAAYICFGAMFWNFATYQDFDKLIKDFQKEE